MRVIIVGAGEVGFQIAKALSYEGIEVVVIDRDKEMLKRVLDELDVAVIEGEGGDPAALKEGGADSADMLLAVANSDETNMIACLLAKAMFGIPRKIARIRNPDYFNNEQILNKNNLDINPAINPELEAAMSIIRLLEIPIATDVEDFEGGIIRVVAARVDNTSHLIRKSLKDISRIVEKKFLIGMIERDEKAIIPSGDHILSRGDIIYIPLKKSEVFDILASIGFESIPARKIMILGGGRIGSYVASKLETAIDIKLIEKDKERCSDLSRTLKKTLILHGDGSDQKLLIEENIGDMDVFVAISNSDELNIMASLLAKKLGVKKTIVIVNKPDYITLARGLGLHTVLSPRNITAGTILRYVRRGDILSLTSIAEGKAEILEARVGKNSRLVGKSLIEAKIPRATLIGAIIREDEAIIPSGTDKIYQDDKLIIFTLRESLKNVEKILT